MTAMVDVVFLLLVFFVFASTSVDVQAILSANQPSAAVITEAPLSVLTIYVAEDGLVVKGRHMDGARLDALLERTARYSPTMNVNISCEAESRHADLIRVINLCEKHQLREISVLKSR